MSTKIISKSIFTNLSSYLFQTAISVVITIFLNAYIARMLGPKQFGIFTLGIAIISIFSFLTALGVRPVTVRKISKLSKNTLKISQYLSLVINARIIFFIFTLIMLVCFLGAMQYSNNIKALVYILSIGLLFDTISTSCRDLFQGIERLDYVAYLDIIVRIVSAVLSVAVIAFGLQVFAVAFSYSTASLVALMMAALIVYKIGVRYIICYEKGFIRELIKESFPFLLTGFVSILYLRIDAVIISKIANDEAVGFYNASANLIARSGVVPDAFASALFPVLIRKIKDKSNDLLNLFERYFRLILFFGMTLHILLVVFAKFIILGIFGEAFFNSINIMKILAHLMPFIFLSKYLIAALQASNCESIVMKLAWISVMLNIIFDILLIPHYGINGAAFATLLSQIVFCGSLMIAISNKSPLSIPISTVLRAIIIFTICAGLGYSLQYTNYSDVSTIAILVGCYCCLIFSTRYITTKDMEALRSLIKKR